MKKAPEFQDELDERLADLERKANAPGQKWRVPIQYREAAPRRRHLRRVESRLYKDLIGNTVHPSVYVSSSVNWLRTEAAYHGFGEYRTRVRDLGDSIVISLEEEGKS